MQLLEFFMTSIAVATASVTLTRSSIFTHVRLYIAKGSSFFGDLFHCPYCMAHWLAFCCVLYEKYRIMDSVFMSWLALVGTSAVVIGIITKLISFKEGENGLIDRLREALKKASEKIKELENTTK